MKWNCIQMFPSHLNDNLLNKSPLLSAKFNTQWRTAKKINVIYRNTALREQNGILVSFFSFILFIYTASVMISVRVEANRNKKQNRTYTHENTTNKRRCQNSILFFCFSTMYTDTQIIYTIFISNFEYIYVTIKFLLSWLHLIYYVVEIHLIKNSALFCVKMLLFISEKKIRRKKSSTLHRERIGSEIGKRGKSICCFAPDVFTQKCSAFGKMIYVWNYRLLTIENVNYNCEKKNNSNFVVAT